MFLPAFHGRIHVMNEEGTQGVWLPHDCYNTRLRSFYGLFIRILVEIGGGTTPTSSPLSALGLKSHPAMNAYNNCLQRYQCI